MTTAHASSALSEDAAISAAVYVLLAQRGESVSDLAYHTRISVASLYRKIGGETSWKAADLGAVARHYGLQPGDLFLGKAVAKIRPSGPGGPSGGSRVRHQGLEPRTRWLAQKRRSQVRPETFVLPESLTA